MFSLLPILALLATSAVALRQPSSFDARIHASTSDPQDGPASQFLANGRGFPSSEVERDFIPSLPGQPPNVSFRQFSGYVTVDPPKGRALFYWFVEAATSADTAPLTLWLTGGPGCSSLSGAFTEMGPFYPSSNGQSLHMNPYSWNNVSNMLFLESPANVGFSYSNSTEDNSVGDARTALDAFLFLQGFLKRFPNLASRPFYITGESYGGHYVPQLADVILQKNQEGSYPRINLGGFMVGNAWTHPPLDNKGALFFWWSHALISDETFHGILHNCDFGDVGPLKEEMEELDGEEISESGESDLCDAFVDRAFQEMGLGDISIYDIYEDVCRASSTTPSRRLMNEGSSLQAEPRTRSLRKGERGYSKRAERRNARSPAAHLARAAAANSAAAAFSSWSASMDDRSRGEARSMERAGGRTAQTLSARFLLASAALSSAPGFGMGFRGDQLDPCIDDEAERYFNLPEVQEALHVTTRPVRWQACSDTLDYSRADLLSSVLPVYERILGAGQESTNPGSGQGIKILVYSGDVDAIVPVTGTRFWLRKLGLKVEEPWRPWLHEGQVGGYATRYSNLNFSTVRDAGHMVPFTQPSRGFHLFKSFIQDSEL